MRVLVNRESLAGPKTGVGHYTAELLRRLQARSDVTIGLVPQETLFQAKRLWRRVRTSLGGKPQPTAAALPSRISPLTPWKRFHRTVVSRCRRDLYRAMCSAAVRGGHDLYHEPNHLPLAIELPTVVTLHDLSAVVHPEWHPAERVAEYDRHFSSCLTRARHFLAVSEFTRREVIRLLGVAPDALPALTTAFVPAWSPYLPPRSQPCSNN